MDIQQRPTTKTFPPTEISSNLVSPSIKKSWFEMLNRASQITKQGQTGPRPHDERLVRVRQLMQEEVRRGQHDWQCPHVSSNVKRLRQNWIARAPWRQ